MDSLEDRWAELDAELHAWAIAGHTATFWWRDDDASAATPALDRLLELRAQFDLPLVLAVPPAHAQNSLAKVLAGESQIAVTVHGLSHTNHAPAGEKKAEFGAHRPIPEMCTELSLGLERLAGMFGIQAQPVLVPPWNRIAPELLPHLVELGYSGISTYRAARVREPAPGLLQTNCHLDIVDWRGTGNLQSPHLIVAELVTLLRQRRTQLTGGGHSASPSDPWEPTGILTHHLAHEPAAWSFLEALFSRISMHVEIGSAVWVTCAETFAIENDVSRELSLNSGKR